MTKPFAHPLSGLKPHRMDWRDTAVCILLLVAATAVLGKGISEGGMRHGDSAVHGMDGVLIRDWIAAGPDSWMNPMAFAMEQYAYYPSLAIGRHYPPGFAVVEAAFFSVFGISPTTARLCVLSFGLAAVAGTYLLLRSLTDRTTGALGAIALVTMPTFTVWGRQTMLEVPTMAALIWAAVSFSWYLRSPSGRRLGAMLAITIAAVFLKQTGVFLIAAAAAALVMLAFWKRVPRAHAAYACIVACVAVAVVAATLGGHGAKLLHGNKSFAAPWCWESVSYYFRILPRQVGWPLLVMSIVGVVLSFHRLRGLAVYLVVWFLVCYVMLTVADYKNPRYLLLGLFPFAIWAALGTGAVLRIVPNRAVRAGVCSLLVLGCCGVSLAVPVERRPDYGPIVDANRDRIEGQAVLFSGLRDGDFVFAVRQYLPWRSTIVLRGSKLLYTCNGRPDLDFVSQVSSREALSELMEKLALRHVFVERENKLHLMEEAWLRDYLSEGDDYHRVASYALQVDPPPSYRNITLDLYELAAPTVREIWRIEVPIPRANLTIPVDLNG